MIQRTKWGVVWLRVFIRFLSWDRKCDPRDRNDVSLSFFGLLRVLFGLRTVGDLGVPAGVPDLGELAAEGGSLAKEEGVGVWKRVDMTREVELLNRMVELMSWWSTFLFMKSLAS